MRRVLLFAAFLLLLGLSTAFAASFEVEAEDIASFTTDVSISVPSRVETYYLKNDPAQPPGNTVFVPGLLEQGEPGSNSVQKKTLVRDPRPITDSQSDLSKYHAWEGVSTGITLSGPATLYIHANGGTRELTAALFECWTPAPGDPPVVMTVDADVDEGGCAHITSGQSTGGTMANGHRERTVVFSVPPTVIESGHVLRLKIVNQTSADWELQWGFNSARSSQLQVTVT